MVIRDASSVSPPLPYSVPLKINPNRRVPRRVLLKTIVNLSGVAVIGSKRRYKRLKLRYDILDENIVINCGNSLFLLSF